MDWFSSWNNHLILVGNNKTVVWPAACPILFGQFTLRPISALPCQINQISASSRPNNCIYYFLTITCCIYRDFLFFANVSIEIRPVSSTFSATDLKHVLMFRHFLFYAESLTWVSQNMHQESLSWHKLNTKSHLNIEYGSVQSIVIMRSLPFKSIKLANLTLLRLRYFGTR